MPRVEVVLCKYLERNTGRCLFQEQQDSDRKPTLMREKPADFTRPPYKKTLSFCGPWNIQYPLLTAEESKQCNEFKNGKRLSLGNTKGKH